MVNTELVSSVLDEDRLLDKKLALAEFVVLIVISELVVLVLLVVVVDVVVAVVLVVLVIVTIELVTLLVVAIELVVLLDVEIELEELVVMTEPVVFTTESEVIEVRLEVVIVTVVSRLSVVVLDGVLSGGLLLVFKELADVFEMSLVLPEVGDQVLNTEKSDDKDAETVPEYVFVSSFDEAVLIILGIVLVLIRVISVLALSVSEGGDEEDKLK